MTEQQARETLLKEFHTTRLTKKVSVSADALYVVLYGESDTATPERTKND